MNSFFVIFVASLVTCHLGPDDIDFKRNNALKLLYKDKKFTFLPENLQLSEGEKSNIRFACPEYYQYFSRTPSQHCIVPRNELQYEQCATEFVPIVDKVVSCDNGGTLYTLKYDICHQDATSGRPVAYYLHVYFFCFDTSAKKTLYTLHRISSTAQEHWMQKIGGPRGCSRFLQYKPLENFQYDFTDSFEAYNMVTPNADYLIPELLVPLDDLEMELGRGVNLHFHNTGAMWKSKQLSWDQLNEAVWQHVQKNGQTDFIMTSMSDMYDVKVNEAGTTISVASLWWKHVKTSRHSYIVVLYNISKENPRQVKSLCVKSICTEIGLDIHPLSHIQCCDDNESVWNRLKVRRRVINQATVKNKARSV